MARDIVVGYDGTDCAKAALGQALAIARDLGAPIAITFGYGPSQLGGEVKDMRDALRELGDRLVHEAESMAAEAGVKADVVLVDARPAEGLVRVAAEREARMIVVGSHGERPLAAAILGSTPHRLLHMSTIPVLVVPA